MKLSWLFSLMWIRSSVCSEVQLYPPLVQIIEGGSVSLKLKSSEDLQFVNCDVEAPFHKSQHEKSDNGTVDHYEWVNITTCEMVIKNVSRNSEGQWKVIGHGSNGSFTSQNKIIVIPLPLTDSVFTTTLGSLASLDCLLKSNSHPTSCQIYNPSGEMVSNVCSVSIPVVRPKDGGVWMCKMSIIGAVRELYHRINVTLQSFDTTPSGSVSETKDFIRMTCTANDPKFEVKWCRVIMPDGGRLMLNPGSISGRYSAADTDLRQKTCDLKVALPLDHETDHGFWRIDLGQSNNDFTGCFFTLPNKGHVLKRLPEKEKSIQVVRGSHLTFDCSVQWPIKYCYLIKPNGDFVQSHGVADKRKYDVGICSIEIKNLTESDVGRWTCGVSSENFEEDSQIYTDISITNSSLVWHHKIEKTKTGTVSYLKCKSPEGHPLNYCRFITPQKTAYNLEPSASYDSRFTYWGEGLEYGECGIRIKYLKSEDEGSWMCAVSYKSKMSNEEYATFEMQRSEPATAFAIGLSLVGLAILASAVVYLGIRCHKKKQQRDFRNNMRNASIGSSEDSYSRDRNYVTYMVENRSRQGETAEIPS